jgi:hypothetical protein
MLWPSMRNGMSTWEKNTIATTVTISTRRTNPLVISGKKKRRTLLYFMRKVPCRHDDI